MGKCGADGTFRRPTPPFVTREPTQVPPTPVVWIQPLYVPTYLGSGHTEQNASNNQRPAHLTT